MLEKEQRKALRREAKEIRENFAQIWGDDAETRKKRESLQARYAEIQEILQSERKRVLAACRQIWEDYAGLRTDQDEQRESLMARYKELYHVLRKNKEDKSKITPGSEEDIPSPKELAEGKQPPGAEVVFDFSSFIVSEEHSGDAPAESPEKPAETTPISDRETIPGKPLPTFSESGEVTHKSDTSAEDAPEASASEKSDDAAATEGQQFTLPSLEETGGLPLVDPGDFEASDKGSAKLADEVWVENEEKAQGSANAPTSGLDELDLDDLLGGGEGKQKTPPATPTPEKPRPDEQATQIGATPPETESAEFLDAAWDSSPETSFPQSAKRDEALPPLNTTPQPQSSDTEEAALPPLQDFEQDNPKEGDDTTDSGSWDAMQKNAKKQSARKDGDKDEDDGDVIFG